MKNIHYICIVYLKQRIMEKETFLKQIKGTQFEADLSNDLTVNGAPTSKAYWNLILSIRDCKLYSKGIKINRFWKITDVKRYFGVKGSADVIAETLEQYRLIMVGEK